ncbi:MAG: adenylate/guanylate cyclase domain-containing protein, partial [Bacteroidota bacterium]
MGPVIQTHNGFVNQFYGDGIMALFLGNSGDALQAGREMMRTLKHYNAERADKQREPLRIGIGLHTGSMMMGMIGDEQRLDTGLVSDTVNTAARLEGITKRYAADILFSEAVYSGLQESERQDIRLLGRVQVVGKQATLNIYECFSENPAALYDLKAQSTVLLHGAFEAYFRQDFKTAREGFAEVLRIFPDDPVASRQLELSQYWAQHPLPEGWNGSETMQKK